jgi:hypothetical protein
VVAKKQVVKPIKKMKGRPRGGASVPCPRCGKDSQVIITRRDGDEVNRRRVCKGRAEHLFDTVEMYHARAG